MKLRSPEISQVTKVSLAANVALGGIAWIMHRRAKHFERESRYDGLTGLLNAAALKRDIADLHDAGKEYSIIWGDADNFKKINDTYGHVKGDYALKGLASAFQRSFRLGDKVYRPGGDELAAIIDETKHEDTGPFDHHQTVGLVTKRVEEHVGDFVSHDDQLATAKLGLSIGSLRVKPGPDMTPDDALHAVDQLMYANKQSRRQ